MNAPIDSPRNDTPAATSRGTSLFRRPLSWLEESGILFPLLGVPFVILVIVGLLHSGPR